MALEAILRSAINIDDNSLRGSQASQYSGNSAEKHKIYVGIGLDDNQSRLLRAFERVADSVESGLQDHCSTSGRASCISPREIRLQQALQRPGMELAAGVTCGSKQEHSHWVIQGSASDGQRWTRAECGRSLSKQSLCSPPASPNGSSSSSSSRQRFDEADMPCSHLQQQQQYAELAPFLADGYMLSNTCTCSSQPTRLHSQSAASHSTCGSGLSGFSYGSSCTSMSTSSTTFGRDRTCSSMSSSSSSHSHLGATDTTWILPQYANSQVLSDYEFGKQLGIGTFGVTRLVRDRTSAGPAACKSICKGQIAGNQTQIQDIRREVAIMEHLAGHSSVVNLRGVYEDSRQVHLVMDLCTGGDLHEHITSRPRGRLSEKDAAAVAKSMLEALAFCHARGVIHRDVKPENFLLEKQGTVQAGVKVSDFGVSAWYQPGELLQEIVGTPYYMAPEVIQRRYGPEADIWSAGVVLYLMLTGRLPFNGSSDRQVVQAVLKAEPDYSEKVWSGVSPAALAVVKAMLVKDSKQRAGISTLLQQEWFMQFGLGNSTSSSSNGNTSPSAAPAAPVAAVCSFCRKRAGAATMAVAPKGSSSSSAVVAKVAGIDGTGNSGAAGPSSTSGSSNNSPVMALAQASCSPGGNGRGFLRSGSCVPSSPSNSSISARSSSSVLQSPFASAAAAGASNRSVTSSGSWSSSRTGSSSSLFVAAPVSPSARVEMSSGWSIDPTMSSRCRRNAGRPSCEEAAGLAVLLGLGSGSYY